MAFMPGRRDGAKVETDGFRTALNPQAAHVLFASPGLKAAMNELVPVAEVSRPPGGDALRVGPQSQSQQLPAQHAASVSLAVLDNRWLVVGLLLVAGPMGLPALWFSRRFSKGVKIGVSIAYAVVTVALPVAMVWYWCETAVRPLVDALAR
jgi:hypothetical protein